MDIINKSWKIISNKSKLRLQFYFILIFIVSILEVIGISFILPIISAISNDLLNSNLYVLDNIINYFKIETKIELISYLLGLFLLFIILKNIFISFFLL